jgi:hypothetical protein
MAEFGENKLHPLLIKDARDAAHQASENQRGCEDRIRNAGRELAEAERVYRKALATKILNVRAEQEVAWSVAGDVARGDKHVADKKFDRDVKDALLEAAKQEAFRRGADRRDIDTLLNWSMRRDLRVDTPPAGFTDPTPQPEG